MPLTAAATTTESTANDGYWGSEAQNYRMNTAAKANNQKQTENVK